MFLHLFISTVLGYLGYCVLEKYGKKAKLKNLIKRRKTEQANNFEWAKNNFEKLDEKRAAEIVELSFFDLQESLQNGKIKPTEALRAYQRKAYDAQLSTNCLCLYITEAMDIASELEQNNSKGVPKPPLFGIPFSVKESIHVKNLDSTQGYSQKLFQPSQSHSTSVEQLIRLGAVPFVHTNIPQALLSFGCCNPIYGSTSNPLDASRVPGGSSGGESALIAFGGSPFGIGTDVGGSIRTPATFCGIAGFKSSSDRSPQMGKVASIPGRQLLQSVEGPIAPNIDVCIEYLKLKWNDEKILEADVYMPPVAFQNELFESDKKLNIGYYTFDGYQLAAPAYQRAVRDTVRLLQEEGHKLVEFQVPRPDHMFNIFCAGATSDGGVYLNRSLGDDIVPPECYIGFPVTKLPYFLQKLLRKYIPDSMRRMRGVLRALPHDCEEMREMHEKIEDYRHEFVLEMRKQNLDAIVCPAFGTYAPRHGSPNKMISATSYTALYNLLDFAAGTVPITYVTAKDDADISNLKWSDAWDKLIKEESVNCKGLPISVQIAAPPYREETCLRLLKVVESKIGLKRRQ